ncbi:uncharacterized protein LOC117105342 [Anneissia japonica]|uniref:uncharacterized protein LOC117105342 n=1 Tax=Anneissia japonica TaxID=1529436 RepID=UPI001425ABDE|nr:uncharacterized protein LOC117105342 [Anneissia japonica]XP_033102356.1 uncharacterized protein LOC117105342 [Anneissia japonica]
MNARRRGNSIHCILILFTLLQTLPIANCFRNIRTSEKRTKRCELANATPFEEVYCTRDNNIDLICTDIENAEEELRAPEKRIQSIEEFSLIKYHFDEPQDIEYVCNNTNDYTIRGGVATRNLAAVEKELKEPNIESPHCVINVFLPDDRNETMPGDLVDFVCMTFGGNPLPTVKMYKGESELPAIDQSFDDTRQFYYRTNVYEVDNGLDFSCVMSTPALETERTCVAHALHILPTAEVAPKRYNGFLGDTVTFTCSGEGVPSIESYTWTTSPPNAMKKMGKRLQISEDTKSVTVRNLKRQDHKVRFYCTVATVNGLTAESRGKIWLDLPTTTLPPTTTIRSTTNLPPTTISKTTNIMQSTSHLVDTADIGPRIAITQTPKGKTGWIPKMRTRLPPPLLPQITTEPPVNATEVGSTIPKDDPSITQRIIVIIVLCLLFLFILICIIIWIAYRKFQYTKPRSKLTLDEIVIIRPRAHQDVHTDRDDYAVPDVPVNTEQSDMYSPLRPCSEVGLFVSEHYVDNNNITVEADSPIYATPMTKRKDPEGSETPNEDDNIETQPDSVTIQNGGVTYATCMKQMFKNKLTIKEGSSFEELFKNFDKNSKQRLFSSQSLSSLLVSEDADGYLEPSIVGSASNIPPSKGNGKSKIERSKSFAAPGTEPLYASLDNLLDSGPSKEVGLQFAVASSNHSPTRTATKVVEAISKEDIQPTKPDGQEANVPNSKPSPLQRPSSLPKKPPKIAKKPVNRNNSSSGSSRIQRTRPTAPLEPSYLSLTPMFSPEKPSYVPRKPASFIS